ncbi:MAG: hypothetical protein ABIS51_07865 [Sphingomonas sp.]
MTPVFTIANKAADFLKDVALIKAAAALIAQWPAMPAVNDGRSLVAFLDDGGAKFGNDTIKAAFGAVGLAAEYKLVADNLATLLGKVDALEAKPIARLFDRLDRFQDSDVGNDASDPGLIRWQPLTLAENAAVATGVSIGLDASAAIEFEAGDQWPYASDSAADPTLTNLLRIGATGAIKGAGDASVPFPIGSLKVGASASKTATLAYYFKPPNPGEWFGIAVAERITTIPDPIDFSDIWETLGDRARTSDLKGIDLHLDGAVDFAAEVALAIGRKIKDVGAISAGLGIKASVSRASHLQVSMRAVGPDKVAITLSRSLSRSSTSGVDLGVTLDATELSGHVATIVNDALDKWDAALDPIRPWLSPGTLLRDKLSAVLATGIGNLTSNASLKDALVADAQRALGLAPGDAGLAAWVGKQITDAVSRNATVVRDGGTNAVDALIKDLGPSLSEALARDTDAVKAEIAKLVGSVETSLNTAIAGLFDTLGGRIADLLKQIGVAVEGVVQTLDDATAVFRKLFALFDAKVAQIRAITAKAALAKLQLSVTAETTQTSGSEYLIAGTFTANTPEAQALFHLIMGGKGQAIADLFAAGDVPGFTLDRARSFLIRSASWKDRTAFSLIVFGFNLGGELLLTADAKITITGNNDISVTAGSAASDTSNTLDGSQILSFSSPYAWSPAAGGGEPVMTVNLGIDRFEKNLKASELQAFLGNLQANTLLDQTAIGLAAATLKGWGLADGADRKVPGRIKLGMTLDLAATRQLIRLTDRVNNDLPEAVKIQIVGACVNAFIKAGKISRKQVQTAAQTVAAAVPDATGMTAGEVFYKFATLNFDPELVGLDSFAQDARARIVHLVGGYASDGTAHVGKALHLIDALDALGDLYEARPWPVGTWKEGDYLKAEKRVASGIGAWLAQVNSLSELFTLSDTLSKDMLAFLLLVIQFSGLRPPVDATTNPPGAGSFLHLEMANGPDGQEQLTVIV